MLTATRVELTASCFSGMNLLNLIPLPDLQDNIH